MSVEARLSVSRRRVLGRMEPSARSTHEVGDGFAAELLLSSGAVVSGVPPLLRTRFGAGSALGGADMAEEMLEGWMAAKWRGET